MRRAPWPLLLTVMLSAPGCGDGAPADAVDAPAPPPIDAPDGPLLDPVTIVMAVRPDVRRPLRFATPVTPFVATLESGDAGLDLTADGVRASGAGLRVLRGRGRVSVAAGVIPVELVVAVGGAVFHGEASDDALAAANWDDAGGGTFLESPWVFVAEAINPPRIPAATVRRHDILLDRLAPVITDHVVVTDGARFIGGSDRLVTTSTTITRTDVECRGASVEGIVPMVTVPTTCAIHTDVTTERIDIRGGILTIDGGAVVDTGVGESFARLGGTLVLASGTLRNGRYVTIGDGSSLDAAAGTRIEVVALDLTDPGSTATLAGDVTASWRVVTSTGTSVATPAGATLTSKETAIGGTWQNGGMLTLGHFTVGAGATFANTGTATATSCDIGGTITGADPCP